ncbi:MAG: hypothetical protein ACRC4O_01520 [Giesbergeria sp.]
MAAKQAKAPAERLVNALALVPVEELATYFCIGVEETYGRAEVSKEAGAVRALLRAIEAEVDG